MKKPKLDWDAIHEERLMRARGVENYNYKKPLEVINKVNCGFCGKRLKDNAPKTERDHLEKCSLYRQNVKAGRVKESIKPDQIKERFKDSRGFDDFVPLSRYQNFSNFPFCTLGKVIKTKNFIGKVFEISGGGEKITLVNKVGEKKTFLVKILIGK